MEKTKMLSRRKINPIKKKAEEVMMKEKEINQRGMKVNNQQQKK
jgi:hypothetical protein